MTLLYFANITHTEFRRRIYVALVVNLMMPLIAWQAFRLIAERQDRRAKGQEPGLR